jgi:hydroxymethylglutaryl-CoA lyase
VVYMLQGMGVHTGVDLEALCQASRQLQQLLRRPLPSRYLQAGPLRIPPAR